MRPAQQESLLHLLSQVERGEVTAIEAAKQIPAASTAETEDACIDLDRAARCGFPEVVYCPGKPVDSIVAIFGKQLEANQNCLGTRVSPDQAAAVLTAFPRAIHNETAATIRLETETSAPMNCPPVFVVAAGTTDRPVAEEALETLRWMGIPSELIIDVGVAGPQRLTPHVAKLQTASAIVVAAGMEGALPSVVGGHVSCPVIGVPTSVGYGANFGGTSAMLSMLNSCASNVAVVNIDAGFKGGYVAGLIASGRRIL